MNTAVYDQQSKIALVLSLFKGVRDIIVNLRHLRNAIKYYFGKAEKQKKDSQTNKKRWPGMKLKRFENHEAEKKP